MAVSMLQLSCSASCAVRCAPEWCKDQATLGWYQQEVLGCLGHAHKQKHLRVCAPPAESSAKFRKAFARPSVGRPAVAVVAVSCAAIAVAASSAAPRQVAAVSLPAPALPCLAPASVPVEVAVVVGAPVQVRTVAVPAAPVQVRTVAVLAAKKETFVVKGPRTLVLPVVAPVCPASRMLMEGDFPSLKLRQERKNEPAAVPTSVPGASVPYQLPAVARPAVALLPVAVVAVAPYCSPACCCCCRCCPACCCPACCCSACAFCSAEHGPFDPAPRPITRSHPPARLWGYPAPAQQPFCLFSEQTRRCGASEPCATQATEF